MATLVLQPERQAVFATPASADLDGNGKVDLVWVTGVSSDGGPTVDNGLVHIWEPGDFNRGANPWPMFKRTGSRISTYRLCLENPIFNLSSLGRNDGDLLTVSVEVVPGLAPVVGLNFRVVVAGKEYTATMADDGATGIRLPEMAATRPA